MKSLGLTAVGLLIVFFSFVPSVLPAGFDGLTVTTITLKDDRGSLWPQPERLLPLIMQRPGAPFSRSDISRGLEYLYLKGLFKDVRVDAFPDNGGVRLEYTLFPITIVATVAIHGNHELSGSAIRAALPGLEGRELPQEKLLDISANIQTLYQAEGFYDTRVRFRTEQTTDPHRVILHVDITESVPTLIEDIRFTGNRVFTDKQLLSFMKSRKGRPLRRDVLLDRDTQAILEKYEQAGYLASRPGVVNMSFQGKKVYLTITGNEGPKVTITFSGNREFSSSKLSRNLIIWSEHDISETVIDSSVDSIKKLYRERGYPDVHVDVKRTEAPGKVDLEFVIQEGPKVSVRTILIRGNTVFTVKYMKRRMALRESGWFSSQPFREDLLDKDGENINDQYVDAGYLDVSVEKKVTRSVDGKAADVLITITEGRKTTVGSLSFEGNTVFTMQELLGKISLKPGMPYSERAVEDDRYRIRSSYSNKGYLYAGVEAVKTVSKAGEGPEKKQPPADAREQTAAPKQVDVRYGIAEDRLVTVGRIILRGNERTKDEVIMRELLVKPGDAYNYEAILKSQQNIYRLGFFGQVRFEPVLPGEKEYVKDMLLTVEERPAGAVEFGFGYGNLDRFRGFAELSYRNLWGSASYASIRIEGSDIIQRGIFNYREPWFLGHKLESRFNVVWSDQTELNEKTREIYYQTRKTTVGYGVEKVFNGLKASLTYQFENVDNYNVSPGVVPSAEDQGRVRLSSLTPAVIWDLRDNPFNPAKGSLHGVSVKEAMKALGSEADFTKVTVQTSWYLPLGDRLLGALSARAGMAWPHQDTAEIPLNERFKLGGGNTVRGYLQDMVGPTSIDPVTGNLVPTGGDSMVLFNGELRINPSKGFGLVLFTDAGNVWTGRDINLDDLRASYGAGIRYNTPVGPLRLDYGQKIHRLAGESPGQLHFSIGQAF